MKYSLDEPVIQTPAGRSREGAWIEMVKPFLFKSFSMCRSREGAWIEISIIGGALSNSAVAPVRERGLKFALIIKATCFFNVAPVRERGLKSKRLEEPLAGVCRSREGAWIEIALSANYNLGEGVSLP